MELTRGRVLKTAASSRDPAAAVGGAESEARRLDEGEFTRVLTLARLLAERLLQGELTLAPERIEALARECLDGLPPGERCVVKAHADDLPALRATLRSAGYDESLVTVIVDPRLARGSLKVETQNRVIDGTLSVRLTTLLEQLLATGTLLPARDLLQP